MSQQPPSGGAWGPPPPPPAQQHAWGEAQQPGPPGGYGPPRPTGTNALAIVSLVTGIIWIFGIGSAIAVITGIIALSQIRQRDQGGKGLAIAGIALGAAGVVGTLLLVILAAAVDEGIDEAADAFNERHAVTVRVEAPARTCWTGTFAGASREGCGNAEFSAQESFITTAYFSKKSDYVRPDDTSPLTLVLLVDGMERERKTTTADGGAVDASASVVGKG